MKYFSLLLIILAGCSKTTKVPTVDEFEKDQKLLTEWIQKCDKGEYSNLGLDDKIKFCGSARTASRNLINKESAKANDSAFERASERN